MSSEGKFSNFEKKVFKFATETDPEIFLQYVKTVIQLLF